MKAFDEFLQQWQDTREGLRKEVSLIPEDRFDFRPIPEARTILEMLYHIVETERVLSGELCRSDTNLRRQPWPAHRAEYAPHVREARTKEEVLKLLDTSLSETLQKIRDFGEASLSEVAPNFAGKLQTRLSQLQFVMSHEMYHRGQVALCVRLLGIEPALTRFFKKIET